MSVLVVTEREGTIAISVAQEDGSVRQRAVLDAEGAQTSHQDLASVALSLSRLMSWNGASAPEPVSPPAPPARKVAASKAAAPPARALPSRARPRSAPPRRLRRGEEMEAFRSSVVEDVRTHPGSTVKEIAARLREGEANLNLNLVALRAAGAIYRTGRGVMGDLYRYHVSTPEPGPRPTSDGWAREGLGLDTTTTTTTTEESP